MDQKLNKDIDSIENLEELREIAKAFKERAFVAELKLYLASEKASLEHLKEFVDIEKVKELMEKTSGK